MSYDLMVFSKDAAPRTRIDFMKWYEVQSEWTEGHGYDDPKNTTTQLQNWFLEMIQTFPPMNGPYAVDDIDNPSTSDYCIGKDVIYVAFAWSLAGQAYEKMIELAEKHGVGFFDVSSDNGDILFPENGKLKPIDKQYGKSWWKFW